MRILLTNDDGIHAEGLAALERIAAKLTDDIWICAPDAERLPLPQSREIRLEGIALPRLAVVSGADPLALVLAATARPDPGF